MERLSDYGVQVLYGKNIVKDGFSETIDMTEVATRIIPKSYNGYMIAGDAPWIDSPLIEKYPTVHYKVMSFEDVKMRADASEDDETNGTIICDTQEQLEGALKKKCEEQYAAGVDKPKITIKADMELLQNTELYEDVKELEAVSLGDTVHCKHSKLRIVSDARVIELEWDAVRNKLISVTLGKFQYNFLNNVSSIMNRVEQAIRSDGSLIGQQVQGTINGVKAQLRAQSSIAKKQTVRAVLFEDLDPDSPTFGAMCLGTLGFEIASERTADGRDWKWSTFGTGQGFFADFIVAGTMLADRIKGGTLELGGAGNGNGVAKVLNADGNEIVRLLLKGDIKKTVVYNEAGSIYGDAKASDVRVGKTFTSSNGVKITGTLVTSEVKYGTITGKGMNGQAIETGLSNVSRFIMARKFPSSNAKHGILSLVYKDGKLSGIAGFIGVGYNSVDNHSIGTVAINKGTITYTPKADEDMSALTEGDTYD